MNPDEKNDGKDELDDGNYSSEVVDSRIGRRKIAGAVERGDGIVGASDQVEDADDDGAGAEGAAAAAGRDVAFVLSHFVVVDGRVVIGRYSW